MAYSLLLPPSSNIGLVLKVFTHCRRLCVGSSGYFHGRAFYLFTFSFLFCFVLAVEYFAIKEHLPPIYFQLFKVREGRRAANFLELCGFLDYTAISEDIIIDNLYIKLKLDIIAISWYQ